jgi:hypothetical protein
MTTLLQTPGLAGTKRGPSPWFALLRAFYALLRFSLFLISFGLFLPGFAFLLRLIFSPLR